jgi:hypothetical protein
MMIRRVARSAVQTSRLIALVVCTASSTRYAIAASPSLGDQRFKLIASDSAASDFFGNSLGISGSRIIVGAYGKDDAGVNSGSAYLLDKNSGQQLFKLVASDAAAGDLFGSVVGVSGNRAIVGAYFDDNVSIDDGSAYLFDASNGQQLFKLAQPNAAQDNHFGISVGIDGGTAIVGASGTSVSSSDSHSGVAYLFDVATGQIKFTLRAPDAHSGEQFGQAVSVRDNIAIVGAFADNVHGPASGSAYLFNTITGSPIRKFTPADGQQLDQFGNAVAVSSSYALVGAALDDDNGVDSGSAYVFDVNTGQQLFKLKPSDGASQARFGSSVAFSGNLAIIGAARDNANGQESGAAYIFNLTTGRQILKIRGSDTDAFDDFGTSVGIDGDTIVGGAPFADLPGGRIQAGAAYLFAVPEPSTLALTGLALSALTAHRRKSAPHNRV